MPLSLVFGPTRHVFKKFLAVPGIEKWALTIALVWLFWGELLAVLAWGAKLLASQGAMLHWLVVGALPSPLAPRSLPNTRQFCGTQRREAKGLAPPNVLSSIHHGRPPDRP